MPRPYYFVACFCSVGCAGILGFEDGSPYPPDVEVAAPDAGVDAEAGSIDAGVDVAEASTVTPEPVAEPVPEAAIEPEAATEAEAAAPMHEPMPEAAPPLGEAGPPLLPDRAPCTAGSQCTSGACVASGPDADGDGYGARESTEAFCTVPPVGHVANRLDCCDRDPAAHPGQATFFPMPTPCGGYDWDCNGIEELYRTTRDGCDIDAGKGIDGWQATIPGCGDSAPWVIVYSCVGIARADTIMMQQWCR